jgi:hypothetical protein
MSDSDERVVNEVVEQLGVLEPTAADAPQPTAHAFAHLQRQLRPQARSVWSFWSRPNQQSSKGSIEMSKHKSWIAGAVALLVLAALFTIPAVRAIASDFLGLFRVQKFAAVTVSPERLELIERLAEQNMSPGTFEVFEEPGDEIAPITSIEEGEALTGLDVRTISALGAPEGIYLVDGGSGSLTVDLAGARAIMEAVGADPQLLPDSLDGKSVNVSVFDSVRQEWSDGTQLTQGESPYAEYPADVNPTVLGEALLQVLGVEPDAARNMAQSIDWTSTFLLPIPQGMAEFSEVTVDGVTGAAMIPLDEEAGILWQKDGKVHLLTGPQSVEELISLANSLQ